MRRRIFWATPRLFASGSRFDGGNGLTGRHDLIPFAFLHRDHRYGGDDDRGGGEGAHGQGFIQDPPTQHDRDEGIDKRMGGRERG